MQGIQFYEFRTLKDSLDKLKETGFDNLPKEHVEMIVEYESKLNMIYTDYRLRLQEVATVIRQFEEHKLSIRRLMSQHKHRQRALNKK